MGYIGPSVTGDVTAVGALVGGTCPGPVGCQALPYAEAACWGAGLVLAWLAGAEGVPELVQAHWCVGLGHRGSGFLAWLGCGS